MKRAVFEWEIQGTLEIEVPRGTTEEQAEKMGRGQLAKIAGRLSTDIQYCRLTDLEKDNGGF